jgi:hypothetical protein
MLRMAAIILMLCSSVPALAEDRPPQLPENTINCAQFKKTGPKEWTEIDTAVFNLGGIRDIHLTNQPVTPGYFKFGGIDVFPVLEQKCGEPLPQALTIGSASDTKADAPVTLAQNTPGPRAEGEQEAPPAPTQAPAQTLKIATETEDKTDKSQLAATQCVEGKAVYAADPLAGETGEKPAIEIAFQNKMGEGNSDFELRSQRGSETLWAYKGKIRRGRFAFVSVVTGRRGANRLFMPASMPLNTQEIIALTPIFIRPSRSGAGEPILYFNGLHTIFASKESVRRFKFEGKPAPQPLPEVYYFDRCE